jgi:hypothetical protein
MIFSRRRVAQVFFAVAATTVYGWRDTGFARAASATMDIPIHPTIARLASFYPDAAACRRIVSALPPVVLAQLASSGFARLKQNAMLACADGRIASREVLEALLADDFRHGRTVQSGGFLLAETEATLAFVRGATGSLTCCGK